MPLERDFAFIVDAHVQAGEILKSAQAADRALITGSNVFDIYQGTGIPEGKKSVAISVTLQPRDKTLTDTEIESVMQKIVAEVSKKTGATLRG
jgi:phenylalanyl-tRNA synthetase beta chain